MDVADQASSARGSSDPASQLMSQAENSIQELIAFDEVIAELSARPYDPISEWYNKNRKFLADSNEEDFLGTPKQFQGLLAKYYSHSIMRESDPTIPPLRDAISAPRESQTMLMSLILNLLHRLRDRTEMISRAFLIAAESSFEVLFGQLVRVVYVKNPAALPKSDYSFTLDELANFASINEAREALIVHKIESLLREGLDEWAKWLKRTVNISLDQIISDWPVTREIFIRRNMLVHTDGRITERYLSELQRAGGRIEGLSVGQSLTPSVDYIRNSLQRLIALEVLLVFKVRSRLEKSETNELANWLANKLKFLVLGERWESVCLVSDSFDCGGCTRSIQLDVKIDGWLAHKNRDGIDRIEEEVSAWDVSGLDERYVVVKKLLLNILTEEELAGVIQKRIFTQFEVSTHPLFANVRRPGSFKLMADTKSEKSVDETPETDGNV